jgi:hypothetical protein
VHSTAVLIKVPSVASGVKPVSVDRACCLATEHDEHTRQPSLFRAGIGHAQQHNAAGNVMAYNCNGWATAKGIKLSGQRVRCASTAKHSSG